MEETTLLIKIGKQKFKTWDELAEWFETQPMKSLSGFEVKVEKNCT